jgi:hypothetical protein
MISLASEAISSTSPTRRPQISACHPVTSVFIVLSSYYLQYDYYVLNLALDLAMEETTNAKVIYETGVEVKIIQTLSNYIWW